jgi:anti-sigma regulatory factor (Ser/Thr protein kinase)
VARGRGHADSLRLAFDAEPALLVVVRRAVRLWLAARRWRAEDADRVVSMVDETVGNAMEHAYRGEAVGQVEVDVADEPAPAGHRARVVVADHGTWRTWDTDRRRGNGLALVRALASLCEIRTDACGTRVTMLVEAPHQAW